jgi:hypothetical protein
MSSTTPPSIEITTKARRCCTMRSKGDFASALKPPTGFSGS